MGAGDRTTPPFDFYEVVEIRLSPKTRQQGIAGQKGVVIGVAEPDAPGRPVTYAVQLSDAQETWSIDEDDLVTTGRFVAPEAIESGESLRVNQRGEVLDD